MINTCFESILTGQTDSSFYQVGVNHGGMNPQGMNAHEFNLFNSWMRDSGVTMHTLGERLRDWLFDKSGM